ncbi:hypothetical protein Pmani_005459 [Petrolisthes manimaculis]|uniref:Uncharacterized protein n=1 Tax=Petrolisthes manimaculis TaxID=1843537 RepID=A0AAE1QEX8_9EUCA|nr:hypothetical protein Pmani_005459 [Petrolisthes manimaculis]
MRVRLMGNTNPRLESLLHAHPQVKLIKNNSKSAPGEDQLSTVVVTAGSGPHGMLDAYAALVKGRKENPRTRFLADFVYGESAMPQHPHSRYHSINPQVITSAVT